MNLHALAEFLKTVLSTTTSPLRLAVLLCALAFLLFWSMVKKGVIPTLSQQHGWALSGMMVNWFGVLGLVGLLIYGAMNVLSRRLQSAPAPKPDTTSSAHNTSVRQPIIDVATLKNLTYVLDGDKVTLHDGVLEFGSPDMDERTTNVSPAFVHLTGWAFGDITGDGSNDAIAVLDKSDGGSGIYSYLVPVTASDGQIKSETDGYTLGDRLSFRSIDISHGRVHVEVLMHKDSDSLSSPSLFRQLEFAYINGKLICETEPCSELERQSQVSAPLALPAAAIAQDVAPSFDCSKARSPTELAICGNERLRELDGILGITYRKVLVEAVPDERVAIKADEQNWIVERDRRCANNASCLQNYLVNRQNLLNAKLVDFH